MQMRLAVVQRPVPGDPAASASAITMMRPRLGKQVRYVILSLVAYSSNRGRQDEEWRHVYSTTFELENTASIGVYLAAFRVKEHGMFYVTLPLCHNEALGSLIPSWLKRLGLQRC